MAKDDFSGDGIINCGAELLGKSSKKTDGLFTGLKGVAVAGTSAAAVGVMLGSDLLDEKTAKDTLETIKSIESVSKNENAPLTEAALEQERVDAVSKIIRSRTNRGFEEALLGGATLATGMTLAARKREKNTGESDKNEGKSRS